MAYTILNVKLSWLYLIFLVKQVFRYCVEFRKVKKYIRWNNCQRFKISSSELASTHQMFLLLKNAVKAVWKFLNIFSKILYIL